MTALGCSFAAALAAAAAYDLAQRRIPNALNGGIFCLGLALAAAFAGPMAALHGFVGAALGLGVLFIPFSRGLVGGGDVKLVAAMGAWLGPVALGWAVLVGAVGGGALALLILVRSGAGLRREVARNVCFALVTMSAPEVPRRERSQKVPLAVALAAGGIGAFLVTGGVHG